MPVDVMTAIRTRRSVRRFSREQVSDSLLRSIFEAARWAPSAHNKQPWYFIVSSVQEKKEKIAQASTWAKFLPDAPVMIIVCTRLDYKWKSTPPKMIEWFSLQSTAAAIQNLLLAAHSLGLATCWIGDINSGLLAELFTIPRSYEPVAIIALGYPATPAAPAASRRPLEEVVSWQ
jgi:nitroreductase